MHGLLHKFGRIVRNLVAETGREALGKFIHGPKDGCGRGQRVRTWPLKDAQGCCYFVVQIGITRVVLRPELHAGNVSDASNASVGVGRYNDVAELFCTGEPSKGLHSHLKSSWRSRRGLINGTGGDLHIAARNAATTSVGVRLRACTFAGSSH